MGKIFLKNRKEAIGKTIHKVYVVDRSYSGPIKIKRLHGRCFLIGEGRNGLEISVRWEKESIFYFVPDHIGKWKEKLDV